LIEIYLFIILFSPSGVGVRHPKDYLEKCTEKILPMG